jgi:hypothetical protein
MGSPSRRTLYVATLATLAFLPLPFLFGAVTQQNAGASQANDKAFLSGKSKEEIEDTVSKMSGSAGLVLAKKHELDSIKGKSLPEESLTTQYAGGIFDTSRRAAVAASDRLVAGDTTLMENEPSVAVNPLAPLNVVAASHRFDFYGDVVNCFAYTSSDGGVSWSAPISLPLLVAGDICSDPVVEFAPRDGVDADTGVRVYALYMSIRGNASTADIVVSRSDDNGATWSDPVVAIEGIPEETFPDKPWIATKYNFPGMAGAARNDHVFVTATVFNSVTGCEIVSSRSLDGALSFPQSSSPVILASSPDGCIDQVVQGSRPAGGAGNRVLACWYNSETDGFRLGVFDERCRLSMDNGLTYGTEIVAVNNAEFELPHYKCPFGSYERWWGGMFPAIEISADGAAHIVYARDPTEGTLDGECGDVYYTTSTGAPYSTWSTPVMLNDDESQTAQGYATVTSRKVSGVIYVFAAWEDGRNSPAFAPNIGYDIYAVSAASTLSTPPANFRISDTTSVSDYLFRGDYIDSAAAKPGNKVYIVWTDRHDKLSPFNDEEDIYGDRVTLP